MERFALSKWYLDCVTAAGDAFIGYWAELHGAHLSVRYVSAMTFVDGILHERSSIRGGAAPREDPDRVAWDCAALEVRGVWSGPTEPSPDRVLFRRGEGTLRWRCVQPRAEATVRVGERVLDGIGYSEIVTLSLPPWDLPIEELRWGRAHFPGRSVVWVDWLGEPPFRLALVDGAEAPCAEVSDAAVVTAGGRVDLGARRPIREGPVAGSSVGSVPGVRAALARAGLLIDEHKWISSATLGEGGRGLQGIAIHERVRWR